MNLQSNELADQRHDWPNGRRKGWGWTEGPRGGGTDRRQHGSAGAWRDEQKRGRGCWPPVTREAGQSGEGLDPREGGLAGRHAERAGHMEQGARAIQASKSRDSQQGGQRPGQTRTCEPATWRLRQVVRH